MQLGWGELPARPRVAQAKIKALSNNTRLSIFFGSVFIVFFLVTSCSHSEIWSIPIILISVGFPMGLLHFCPACGLSGATNPV